MSRIVNKKEQSDNSNAIARYIKRIIVGTVVGLIVFSAMMCIFAFICLRADVDCNYYRLFVFAAALISGFLCGYCAVLTEKKNGLVVGMVSSMPLSFIVILLSTLLSQSSVSVNSFICIALIVCSSAFGGIVSVNKGR